MTTIFHRPMRRLLYPALVFTLIIFIQTIVQAATVTLAWDPNDPTPDGYSVFQRLEGQAYDYSSPVWPQQGDDPTQTTCTIEGLADDTSYYFVVRANVGSDVSGDSNEINHVTDPAAPIVYTLSTDAGPNGVISPASAMMNAGGSQTFTILPGSGYHIVDVLVDGVSIGVVDTYTFSQVNGDHVIRAVFSVNTYPISATVSGNGTISPGGSTSVAHGDSQTYNISADPGYTVADVQVDGQSVGSGNNYTFSNVIGPHTIRAVFESNQYVITATGGSNGTVSPSGQITVVKGGSHSFTITAHSGYHIADVMVDGVSTGAVGAYTFSNVISNHNLSATFETNLYTIQASSGQGGNISPSGHVSVVSGGDKAFNVTADQGYEIDDLIVDGVSLGVQNSYQFTQVDTHHTIQVLFRAVNHPPTAAAGPDQVVDEQALVTLSGLNSQDLDDGIAAFEWRQVGGENVTLSSLSDEVVTFTAPDVDMNGVALEFELTVTDTKGLQATDSCIVNVTWVNEPPVANAGVDQSVNEGATVVLTASGTMDADDGIGGYYWRQTQGPEVDLINPDTPSPSFKTPDVGPQGTSLAFELTVTDNGGLQDTDGCMVVVTWDNMEPLADAGADQETMAGAEVVLDGSRSMDPDGLKLNYQWRQTFGQPVVLSDATAVAPRFTVPAQGFDGESLTFELTVTDSGGLQGVDVCDVHIQDQAPPEDTTPPTLSVDNPAMGWALVFRRSYLLTGSAHDNQQVSKVTWKNNRGGSGEVSGTDQWSKEVRLYRGPNIITITAVDAAGNQTSQEIVIYRIKWGY
jgi:hypothetical protein